MGPTLRWNFRLRRLYDDSIPIVEWRFALSNTFCMVRPFGGDIRCDWLFFKTI
jgi:hypothetical protein